MLRVLPSHEDTLQAMAESPLFGGPVCLRQVYIALRAYYFEPPLRPGREPLTDALQRQAKGTRTVVVLDEEIADWLETGGADDACRLVVGAPGSGRTAFCVMLAERLRAVGRVRPLYVPLYEMAFEAGENASLMDVLARTHGEAVDTFRSLDVHAPRLLILDGLDELPSVAGERSAAIQWVIGEVRRLVQGCEGAEQGLRVLLTSDETAIEGVVDDFAEGRQLLHLLPLRVPPWRAGQFTDPQRLLERDQLAEWWRSFGAGTGLAVEASRPSPRDRPDDWGSLPLHEYVVGWAMACGVKARPESENVNGMFRTLCDVLVADAAEREASDADERGSFVDGLMSLLEEAGFLAWQGNRRVASVPARGLRIEPGVGGVAAYRRGARGDPHATGPVLGFTHRAFADYLAARWLVRKIGWLTSEARRSAAFDWQRQCLKQWVEWCGVTALDRSLVGFLRNEVRSHGAEVELWQDTLIALVEYAVAHGLPTEDITPRLSHADEQRYSRNAEEALLVALNCCARATNRLSRVRWPTVRVASEWLSRLQGQRVGTTNALALDCLALIDFRGCVFEVRDLIGSDLERAMLSQGWLTWANLTAAKMNYAHLEEAHLEGAHLSEAELKGAHLERAQLSEAHFREANLVGAHLEGADLRGAHLREVCMDVADLRGAGLVGAHFRKASLVEADVRGANLRDAKLIDCRLDGADLRGADVSGTDFRGAVLVDADLRDVLSGLPYEGTAAQLANAKTLYAARLDPDLRSVIEERYAQVLAPPSW